MSRPPRQFVSVETAEQQDIPAVQRIRAELTKQRPAKANQIHGWVAEYGLVAPKELAHLRRALPCWLEDAENGLSKRFRRPLNGRWGDLQALDARMTELDREVAAIAQSDPAAAATARGGTNHCHRAGGSGRHGRTVGQRAADVRRLRVNTHAAQLGWQGAAAGNQQARRRVLASAADSRGSLGPPTPKARTTASVSG
jgi:transposase